MPRPDRPRSRSRRRSPRRSSPPARRGQQQDRWRDDSWHKNDWNKDSWRDSERDAWRESDWRTRDDSSKGNDYDRRRETGNGSDRRKDTLDGNGSNSRKDAGQKVAEDVSTSPGAETGVPGREKAKLAIDKEKEKARLKKLEREKAQQEKATSKEKVREQKREDSVGDIEKQLDQAATNPADEPIAEDDAYGKAHAGLDNVESRAAALAGPDVVPPSPPERPTQTCSATLPNTRPAAKLEKIDESEARKLFDLLDRNSNLQVSKRDILVALRKQPPVRRLFGLPVTPLEEGGGDLEARLLQIQDAFEAGAGLGEVTPTFGELRGDAATIGWEAFFANCQKESLNSRTIAALALLPREHSTGKAFVPTDSWRVVPEGSACPGGLEYKMDMKTGKTMGRRPPKKTPS